MIKHNLKDITNFIENNKDYSDYNLVNDFLNNLNFSKINNKIYKFSTKKSNNPQYNLQGGKPPPSFYDSNLDYNLYDLFYNQIDPINTTPTTNIETALPLQPESAILSPVINQNDPLSSIQNPAVPIIDPNILENLNTGNFSETIISNPLGSNYVWAETEAFTNYFGKQKNQLATNPNYPSTIYNTLPEFQETYLNPPVLNSDIPNTYTLGVGTTLYMATEQRGFNIDTLNFENFNSVVFFTPNLLLASFGLEGCSIHKQKGYIHHFKVIHPITNIYIKPFYNTEEDLDKEKLFLNFCIGSKKYNGVGFFYPKNQIQKFSSNVSLQEIDYYSEFGLCNPAHYLKYTGSQKCMSLRQLSQPYRIDSIFP